MNASLASAITKAASTQTYYTIRFLVDRPRMDDAFRAYAYFRWVDDVLDAEAPLGSVAGDAERSNASGFWTVRSSCWSDAFGAKRRGTSAAKRRCWSS